jgi:tRNA nucleotidyltransferase (CCA-adding enzyme)
VSIERVRDELLKLLDAPKPSVGFEIMRTTGLLALVMPELLEGYGLHQNSHHSYDVYAHIMACIDAAVGRTARLSALFHDIAKPRTAAPREDNPTEHTFYRHDHVGADLTDEIMRRMRFSNDERERISGLVRNHMFWYDPSWSDGAVRRFVGRVGEDNLQHLFDLRTADIIGRGRGEDPRNELVPLQERVARVLSESRALRVTDLCVDGTDVMRELGLPASRRIRDELERLLEAVLEDPSLNTRERLLDVLRARKG